MRLRVIEPAANFSCKACGACCDQPWRTMIEADKAEALRRHDFSKYPQLTGKEFFHAPADGSKGYFDLAKGEGTRCLFLDTDGLCIIHKEMGPAVKPGMCQQFPLLASRTWSDERITLNYACPTVQAGGGSPLSEQAEEISRILPLYEKPVDANVRVPLAGATSLTLKENDCLLDRVQGLFDDSRNVSIEQALAESLTAVLTVGEWQRTSGDNRTSLLRRIQSEPLTSSSVPTPQAWERLSTAPLANRMLFAATLQPDTMPAGLSGKLGLMGRLGMVPRLMSLASCAGVYPSRVLGRNVQIEGVLNHPLSEMDEASTALLRRYVRSRIWARTLTGTRLSILAGLHQHILDLSAVLFVARARAQEASAERLSPNHIQSSLQAVEFHLANQARIYDQVLRGWFRSKLDQAGVAMASLQLFATLSAAVSHSKVS